MSGIIEVENLSKSFGSIKAVEDLSFSVQQGEIYGFLGQNGAGKSTTIRMLLSLIRPGAGSISIFSKDLMQQKNEILANIGAIIEKPDLYKFLTAYENLSIAAKLSGVKLSSKQLIKQLEVVGIAERAKTRVKTFSQGMKQRLGMACALVNNPQIIVLDEPTNGLDPQGIADMRNLILHLSKNEKKTILISSHLLSEIELIADAMLVIDKGRKVVEGKVSTLFDPANSVVHLQTENDFDAITVLRSSLWANAIIDGDSSIKLKMNSDAVPELVKFLVSHNIRIISVYNKNSLEEYFLSLTTPNQHVAAFKN
jgi:ABC-type multidrug transport system ATPase subunit